MNRVKQHFTGNAGLLFLPSSPPRWRFLLRDKRFNDLQPQGLENSLPALYILRVQILVQIECRIYSPGVKVRYNFRSGISVTTRGKYQQK